MWKNILGAIDVSDARQVSQFLSNEPGLTFEHNPRNETLLHYAARHASAATLLEFVRRGARADISDDFGWTPMHEACKHGNEQAVALFIQSGINLNFKSRIGETPLHIAAKHNYPGIVARLMAAGADKNACCNDGNTPVHLAVKKGQISALQTLLNAGAKTDIFNSEGYAPLHLAARHGRFLSAELLLSSRADPYQKDASGKTFMEIAEIFNNKTFVTLMAEKLHSDDKAAVERASFSRKDLALESRLAGTTVYVFPDFSLPGHRSFINTISIFLFGNDAIGRYRHITGLVDAALWFGVFPLLLFILWHALAAGMIPSLVRLNFSFGAHFPAAALQTAVNWLILFAISCLLVESEPSYGSTLHFFTRLRHSILFRSMHFALLEWFFCPKIPLYPLFWSDFAVFWVWFVGLYSISFYLWWEHNHGLSTNQSDSSSEETGMG